MQSKTPMSITTLLFAALALSGAAARAEMPILSAECPQGHYVESDPAGTVRVDGRVARVKKFNENYYEATHNGITYTISHDSDGGGLQVGYNPPGSGGGYCTVTSSQAAPSMPSGSADLGGRAALPPDGPEFWEVSVNTTLNVRSSPTASARVVAKLPRGTKVENRGCLDREGRTWCEIADGDASGWAQIDYLAPAASAGSRTSVADDGGGAMVGTPNVTGDVRVRFAPGESNSQYTNRLGSGQSVTYILRARNGQYLTVDLQGDTRNLDYIIYVPSGDILDQASQSSFRYYGQLYQTGDHRVKVFYNGNHGTFAEFAINFVVK